MKLRPTRHALVFFLILGAMFTASINYQSNAAWLMVFVVACTGAVSAVHGWRNVVPAAIAVGDLPPVQAGDQARLPVTVTDRAGRGLLALVLELPADQHPSRTPSPQRLLIPHVPGYQSVRADLLVAPMPRGRHRIGMLGLSTQYPLGLFRLVRRLRVDLDLYVHPQPAGMPLSGVRPESDAAADRGPGGDHREQEDFRGQRAWQAGDSYRQVDWKAVARSGGPLLVKEYAGGGKAVWLSWSATAGDDEQRLSQLARWVIEADAAGLRYGLRLPAGDIAPAAGAGHRRACLQALAVHPAAESRR